MPSCTVLGCKSRSVRQIQGITFHSYPQAPLIRSQWVRATGRVNWQPTQHSRICSVHFDNRAFIYLDKMKAKKCHAVPTKCIHNQDSTCRITKNQFYEFEEKFDPLGDTESNNKLNGDYCKEEENLCEVSIEADRIHSEEEETNVQPPQPVLPPAELLRAKSELKQLEMKLERQKILCEVRKKKNMVLSAKLRRLRKKCALQAELIAQFKTLNDASKPDMDIQTNTKHLTEIQTNKYQIGNIRLIPMNTNISQLSNVKLIPRTNYKKNPHINKKIDANKINNNSEKNRTGNIRIQTIKKSDINKINSISNANKTRNIQLQTNENSNTNKTENMQINKNVNLKNLVNIGGVVGNSSGRIVWKQVGGNIIINPLLKVNDNDLQNNK